MTIWVEANRSIVTRSGRVIASCARATVAVGRSRRLFVLGEPIVVVAAHRLLRRAPAVRPWWQSAHLAARDGVDELAAALGASCPAPRRTGRDLRMALADISPPDERFETNIAEALVYVTANEDDPWADA